jgi:hypothetical protein
LRALADTGASRSIILEAYTSKPFIKMNKNKNPCEVPWVVSLQRIKLDSRNKFLGHSTLMTAPNNQAHMT